MLAALEIISAERMRGVLHGRVLAFDPPSQLLSRESTLSRASTEQRTARDGIKWRAGALDAGNVLTAAIGKYRVTRGRRRFARLIDDKNEIPVPISQVLARSRDANRRHRSRHHSHRQFASQNLVFKLRVFDRLDVELHHHPAPVVTPHRDAILLRKIGS